MIPFRRAAPARSYLLRTGPLAVVLVAAVVLGACASELSPSGDESPSASPATLDARSQVAPSPQTTPPEATPPVVEVAHQMPRSVPVRVRIPAIDVDSELMDLGLNNDGTMEVPPQGFPAGWYTGAPTPGELGPAIVAGHVDWQSGPGVFHDLADLEPGDEVTIDRKDGSVAVFRVTSVEQFAKDSFPTDLVYGDIDHAGLRLITCGGSIDRAARSHRDNIVVFARIVEPS